MKVRAKEPIRYKGVRYETGEILEINSTDFIFLEPYVQAEQDKNKTVNKKNVGNINRESNENTTTITENIN